MHGRTETSEGNDVKMMLHYYTRFLIIRDLLPRFSESTKVMSVLDSKRGYKDKMDWDDLDLKKGFSLGAAAMHCMSMTDIAMQRFASQNPAHTFIHAYPSAVDTSISRSLPGYIRPGASLMYKAFANSPSNCAEWMFAALNAQPKGARFVISNGDDVKGKELANDAEMEKLWNHSVGLVDKVA